MDKLSCMSLAEIEKKALTLNDRDRARLAAALLETLSPDVETSDEEVMERDEEMRSGRVQEISHAEFVRRAEEARRR